MENLKPSLAMNVRRCNSSQMDGWNRSTISGCSAAWLAHLTGGQEVAGSNPVSPIFAVQAKNKGDENRESGDTGDLRNQGPPLRFTLLLLRLDFLNPVAPDVRCRCATRQFLVSTPPSNNQAIHRIQPAGHAGLGGWLVRRCFPERISVRCCGRVFPGRSRCISLRRRETSVCRPNCSLPRPSGSYTADVRSLNFVLVAERVFGKQKSSDHESAETHEYRILEANRF